MYGRTVLVTGASRGIGRAIALEFARKSYTVALNYHRSKEKCEELASLIAEQGGKAALFCADVSDAQQVDALFGDIEKNLSPVEILINNAGIAKDGLLMRMSSDDWDAVLNTNLKSAFLCTKRAVRPMMKARWGRIISIGSVVGLVGNAGQVNYSAAKAGLLGFTKSAARELASRNITVNLIAPGFIDTDMTSVLSADIRTSICAQIPLGKIGEGCDVAKAVIFLASDDASYITGQTLAVDGGMTM